MVAARSGLVDSRRAGDRGRLARGIATDRRATARSAARWRIAKALSSLSRQVFAAQQENVLIAGAGVEPDEGRFRKGRLERFAIVADLDDQ